MEGERTAGTEFNWQTDPKSGIIPRTMNHLFDELDNGGYSEYTVHVSLIEIYNEEIYDLLSSAPGIDKLKMYDEINSKGVKIKGVDEVAVTNKNEIYAIMERGAQKRKTAATLMNAQSSRKGFTSYFRIKSCYLLNSNFRFFADFLHSKFQPQKNITKKSIFRFF